MSILIALFFWITFETSGFSNTFKPHDAHQVLEYLPRSENQEFSNPELRKLSTQLKKDQNNSALASSIARKLIAIGRQSGDPRPYGQAQAILAPWWNLKEPPLPIIFDRAVILQFNHNFSQSLDDLSLYLSKNPRDVQARLTEANIKQVIGDYPGAKISCEALPNEAGFFRTTCVASAAAMLEDPKAIFDQLSILLQFNTSKLTGGKAGQNYALSVLADIAFQLGRTEESINLRETSVRRDPDDLYAAITLIDAYFDVNRIKDATEIACQRRNHEGFLLRCTRGEKMLSMPQFKENRQKLMDAFAAEEVRGTGIHLRERAYFDLYIENKFETALKYALENWKLQKEIIDAKLLLETALATKNKRIVTTTRQWLTSHGFKNKIFANSDKDNGL
jgi:tetratricopeptide (TPR) repeat protein